MTDICLTPEQSAGVKRIVQWFRYETAHQQVARLFGYAGCGKSTILRFILDELGLAPHRSAREGTCVPGVVTATFTGKAALVLARKGTPARTIHSLIYSVTEATEEEVEAAARKVREAEISVRSLSGFDRTAAEAGIEAMRQALSAMKKPRFALNAQSDAADARLIVLDEVSMVGEEMARDLMSFKKPILVLGDPGQLPPIKGDGAFTNVAPDVMLTEIHRQAAESAIIRLATLAREGQPIGFGRYDDHVAKMPKGDITPDQALRGTPVRTLGTHRAGMRYPRPADLRADASVGLPVLVGHWRDPRGTALAQAAVEPLRHQGPIAAAAASVAQNGKHAAADQRGLYGR